MTQNRGETEAGLTAARVALNARDRAIEEADRALAQVLCEAHRRATDSIRRIDSVRSDIETLDPDSGIDAGVCARLILDRHRDLIDVVIAARDVAAAKTVELQRLRASYHP